MEFGGTAQIGGEPRIVGALELPGSMRLQAVRPPDALHRTDADASQLDRCPRRPVGGLAGRRTQREGHQPCPDLGPQRRDPGGRALSRSRPSTPAAVKLSSQRQTAILMDAGTPHNLAGTVVLDRQQDDLGPPDMLVRAAAICADRRSGSRSAAVMVILMRGPRFAHRRAPGESPKRLLRQGSYHRFGDAQ